MYIYKDFWRKWYDVKGKIDNEDYRNIWFIHLLVFIIALPSLFFNIDGLYWYIVGGYFALALIPIITVTLRRFNDNEVSRLNIFWIFFPVVGVLLIYARMQYDEKNIKINSKEIYQMKREVEHDPRKRILPNEVRNIV